PPSRSIRNPLQQRLCGRCQPHNPWYPLPEGFCNRSGPGSVDFSHPLDVYQNNSCTTAPQLVWIFHTRYQDPSYSAAGSDGGGCWGRIPLWKMANRPCPFSVPWQAPEYAAGCPY